MPSGLESYCPYRNEVSPRRPVRSMLSCTTHVPSTRPLISGARGVSSCTIPIDTKYRALWVQGEHAKLACRVCDVLYYVMQR